MAKPSHEESVGIEVVHVAKGVGVPAMERMVAAAAASLAARWQTGNPDLLDPVEAIEYEGHDRRRGAHLVPNRSRRFIEVLACAPVRAAAMAEICAAAQALGYRVLPGANPDTGVRYLTISA